MSESGNKAASTKRPPSRLWRWCKRLAMLVIVLCVLVVLAWQALTSSWFLAPRIESILSSMIGGKVTIATADLSLNGRLHLTDVRILVPSVKGPAGELLQVPDVTMSLDRDELMAGRLNVKRLTIDDALLRLSENLDTGRFNIGGLIVAPSAGPTPSMLWPRVELRSAIVQVGEHRGTTFQPSGELRVNGSLQPDPSPADPKSHEWYTFDLQEIVPAGATGPDGMHIAGRFNLATAEGSSILSGVTFEPQRAKLLPRVARQWWNAIDPSGSLAPIGFQIGADGRYEIEIAMDGIDWSLPVPSFDPQRDTKAPRMTNVRGSVVIHDAQVDLIGLSGDIDGVHYGLTGSFASVDRSPGFDLTFDVARFDLSRNLNMLTALPISVRELVDNQLIQLGGPTGLLDAHVTLKRAAPDPADIADAEPALRPVRASGRVELLNAEGSYRDFPYPLTGLSGAVEFDDDEVHIVALAGRGPSGGQIFVSGRISPPGPDPQVDVEMYAINVPIDEHLRTALGERRGGAIDEFFNQDWEHRLHQHQLFLASSDVSKLSDEVMALMREYKELSGPEGTEPDATAAARQGAIRDRMTDIQTVLQRPTFELGGRINIRSKIQRERGPSQPTKVSNIISLSDPDAPLGIVYEEFPYPVRLIAGEILIGYDRIEILQDLVVEGVSGGRAVITGGVDRVRQPLRRLEPRLTLHADDLPINEYLLRAIPDRNWHDLGPLDVPNLSKGAQVVAGLRLEGSLTADGTISTDERGKAAFDINVSSADAATLAESEPAACASELHWIWPGSLPLTQVQAELTVHRRSVDIHRFSAVSGTQQFNANGRVDWASGKTDLELNVNGQNIDLKPHLIDLASAIGNDEGVDEMRRFWDRFDPSGIADASLTYHQTQETGHTFDLAMTPKSGSLLIKDHRVDITNPQGALRITPGVVTFEDVRVDAVCEGASAGQVSLDGSLAWTTDHATDLDAKVEGARFEAPVYQMFADGFSQLLSQTDSDAAAPTGSFDASFDYTRPAGAQPPSYLINLQPKMLDVTIGSERFEVRRITGSAIVSPESVELSNLFGSYQDGLIRLSGTVNRSDAVDARLRLSVSADKVNGRVRALLPTAANQLIDAIDLTVGQSLELSDADIHFTRQSGAEGDKPPIEGLTFDGMLNVRDASMNLSIPITELDGSLRLQVQRRSHEPWLRGTVAMNVSRMLVLGRLVTDVQADLITGDDPGLVEVPHLVGDCYGGRLSAEGWLHVPWKGQPGQYDLRLSLAQVAVDPVLRRLAPRRAPDTSDNSGQPPADASAKRPGRLEAGLSIAGIFGQSESRIGCGVIRVRDAELYEVPLAMWALQISALTLPVSTSFREAEIAYFVEGNEVVFERLLLDSPAMSLVGNGVLNYESKALDMRFNTSSKLRAPLLTPLWEGLRDLFMSIHVTGTLEKPNAKLEAHADAPVSATRPGGTASVQTDTTIIAPSSMN